jgi:heme/copper-type cytochrome/quinol oxidase subunit 2
MRRKDMIMLGIVIPIVIVLVIAVVLVSVAHATVAKGTVCVRLNRKNDMVGDKVLLPGLRFRGIGYHFSTPLPDENNTLVGVVETQNITNDITAIVVFKYYIGEEHAINFYKKYGFNITAEDVPNQFSREVVEIVQEVIGMYNCVLVNQITEMDTWCEYFATNVSSLLDESGLPFSLAPKNPVKAVMFDGCD